MNSLGKIVLALFLVTLLGALISRLNLDWFALIQGLLTLVLVAIVGPMLFYALLQVGLRSNKSETANEPEPKRVGNWQEACELLSMSLPGRKAGLEGIMAWMASRLNGAYAVYGEVAEGVVLVMAPELGYCIATGEWKGTSVEVKFHSLQEVMYAWFNDGNLYSHPYERVDFPDFGGQCRSVAVNAREGRCTYYFWNCINPITILADGRVENWKQTSY